MEILNGKLHLLCSESAKQVVVRHEDYQLNLNENPWHLFFALQLC